MPILLTATAIESKVKSLWKVNKQVNSAKLLILTLGLLTLNAGTSQSQTILRRESGVHRITIAVHTGWQFREAGKDKWYPASDPGCVHTDLLNNKLIDDPFYRDNEKKLQWIGKTDWEYQILFNVTAEMRERTNLELVFEGLDTYANVFLNDEPVISTDNMFRTWRVDAKRLARLGPNTLRIRLLRSKNSREPIPNDAFGALPSNDQPSLTPRTPPRQAVVERAVREKEDCGQCSS